MTNAAVATLPEAREQWTDVMLQLPGTGCWIITYRWRLALGLGPWELS